MWLVLVLVRARGLAWAELQLHVRLDAAEVREARENQSPVRIRALHLAETGLPRGTEAGIRGRRAGCRHKSAMGGEVAVVRRTTEVAVILKNEVRARRASRLACASAIALSVGVAVRRR